MILALIAASALGTMPVPLYTARAMDVSTSTSLDSIPGPEWVWVDVVVDAGGVPSRCDVASSSGSRRLDRVACERAMKTGHYEPARDEDGRPVAARIRQVFAVNSSLPEDRTIDFALSVSGPMASSDPRVVDLRVVTDSAGKVASCAVTVSSHVPQLDRLACNAVSNATLAPVHDAGGTPIR
ncbi:MAG: energy transducer TonB, partial [Janthinobacterium lividum]